MIGRKHCPFCLTPALSGCEHLALAVEAREFVRRCVELCEGQIPWQRLCALRRGDLQRAGRWSPERDDFTWLETAFCDEFLKRLNWFGEMDYEWRTGSKPELTRPSMARDATGIMVPPSRQQGVSKRESSRLDA